MKNKKYFPDVLTDLLEQTNMTQLELAHKIGVHRTTISSYCRGVSYPNPKICKLIAEIFHIGVNDLGEKKPKNASQLTHNLKRLLSIHGISQSMLAKYLNVSNITVSRYISGKSCPSDTVFRKLFIKFGFTKEELCEKDVNVLIDKHPDAIGLVEIEKAREQETDHESCDFNEDVVPSNPLCQPDQHPGVSITFVDPAGIEFEPVRDTEENLRQLQIFKNRVRGQRSQETCTKCMFENVVDIVVNGNYSYPADTIQKWARRSICQMTDPWSMNYNPERAAAISDMLFRFFINKRKPLKPDNRYFVREKNGEIFLKRDRGDIDTLHEYAFTHEDEDGNTHATRITMTEAEKEKMTNILRELNVQFVVRDLVDILR